VILFLVVPHSLRPTLEVVISMGYSISRRLPSMTEKNLTGLGPYKIDYEQCALYTPWLQNCLSSWQRPRGQQPHPAQSAILNRWPTYIGHTAPGLRIQDGPSYRVWGDAQSFAKQQRRHSRESRCCCCCWWWWWRWL